jgi:hypothetical protein
VSSFEARDRAARVVVLGKSGRAYQVAFDGVRSLTERRAAGMYLDALVDRAAVRGDPRTFTFVNGGDSDDACLELVAETVTIEPLSPGI